MARYIDADSLYRRVKTHTNPYGKPTLDYKSGVKVLEMINQEPTADVAPKSEVHDDHHKQVACYTLGCREGDKIKREVAREIFDWIERSMVIYNPEIPGLRSISMNVFNALKKKYTEENK